MINTPEMLIETPDMTSKDSFALSSDLVSELLTGMRLRGVQYRRIQTGPEFGMSFFARPGHAYFHYLAVGDALLQSEDGTLHKLSAGSAILLPQGEEHALLSDSNVAVQPIDSFTAAALGDDVSGVDTCPSTGAIPSAILFYGCMEFDLGGMQGLGPLMPPFMLADAQNGRYPGLLPIFTSMKNEICSGRIGFAGILARLAEVMAAMIVRGWVECGCDNASGVVAALRDPRLARAILALHRQPGHDWSVEELAAECNISRSVFAGRFQSTIGISPLRYAAELRMRLASQWLTRDRLAIDTVAHRLGYTSQAAFSRAYKRVIGHPPGASRQRTFLTTS
ncbi:AraC family transcriptional regulator [Agrobacterium tumefaciens]|uniref:AraC family transcriptional regulator n=1 Tax=Agrobacterium tumefaciens TaxID=358 RepID=UPI0009C51970|nr:AraC family transcriptional regulator [Agrobacterium tumefaciens]WCJ66301.1 AraC family transcriptional regulator [Agrobacterium tumefaciens]CUX68386.1 DNA-binding domain-containing protein [Agrobacterium genomosp. 5 str. CFBP 6626]